MDQAFEGEYWDEVEQDYGLSRILFETREGVTWVSAWISTSFEDREWGETKLYLLSDHSSTAQHKVAFATWEHDSGPTHCFFEGRGDELSCRCIQIRDEYPSSISENIFLKNEARSSAAMRPDYQLRKFRHMWETDGWKLVQFTEPVFFVELEFPPEGPSDEEIPMIAKFRGMFPAQTMEQFVEMMKGCSGAGIPGLLNQSQLEELLHRPSVWQIPPTVQIIVPTDYIVSMPDGTYCGWQSIEKQRCAVVERMLVAGVPIVAGKLP